MRFVPSLDMFNVFNDNTVQAMRSTQNATNANQIQAILAPRVLAASACGSTGSREASAERYGARGFSRAAQPGRGDEPRPFFVEFALSLTPVLRDSVVNASPGRR